MLSFFKNCFPASLFDVNVSKLSKTVGMGIFTLNGEDKKHPTTIFHLYLYIYVEISAQTFHRVFWLLLIWASLSSVTH